MRLLSGPTYMMVDSALVVSPQELQKVMLNVKILDRACCFSVLADGIHLISLVEVHENEPHDL